MRSVAEKSLPMPPSTLVRANDAEGGKNSASASKTSRRLRSARMSRKNCRKVSEARRRSGAMEGM